MDILPILLFLVAFAAAFIFLPRNKLAKNKLKKAFKKHDEVDPLAEAEVYLAYGREKQAIEVLEEALLKNPSNGDIVTKLNQIKANS